MILARQVSCRGAAAWRAAPRVQLSELGGFVDLPEVPKGAQRRGIQGCPKGHINTRISHSYVQRLTPTGIPEIMLCILGPRMVGIVMMALRRYLPFRLALGPLQGLMQGSFMWKISGQSTKNLKSGPFLRRTLILQRAPV